MFDILTEFLKGSAIVVVWGKYSKGMADERFEVFERVLPTEADYISSMHAFVSVASFEAYWKAIKDAPEEMWYWVIDTREEQPYCICAGACDPSDEEIYEKYFGEEWGNYNV